MRRPVREAASDAGQDSFLDIVANIVGILIILVMVVGVRIRNVPVDPDGPEHAAQAELTALADQQDAVAAIRRTVLNIESQTEMMRRETAIRDLQRLDLAFEVAEERRQLDSRRDQLDDESRRQFDLRRAMEDSQAELTSLRQRSAAVDEVEAAPQVVKSYPTPLSRPVDDHEAHFQLEAGRVVYVPMQELLREFKADAKAKAHNLGRQSEFTATVGPIGDFRLRYTLHRRAIPLGMDRRTVVMGSSIGLKILSLIPVRSNLGEPLEQALAEGSEFRRALAAFRPGRATVTIWTYPDSFAEFRRLKHELFVLGYETAARPMPQGMPIFASPEGTRSAAQ